MKQLNLILTLFCILLAGVSSGQAPMGFTNVEDIAGLKNKIIASSEQTRSIKSDFEQEKHLTMMDEVLISHGRFLFKKENKVKWEYIDPIIYAIIINQNSFIINNDGKISEFDTETNKLFKEINNMIVMAIQGNFVDNPDFDASFYQDEKEFLAVLEPQDKMLADIITGINVYFLKEDISVSRVIFIEPGEDFTQIRFSNRQANIEIEDELFSSK